jgi:N-6 DNA methylase
MSLLIQGNPSFQAIERAMRNIGYRDDLLRRPYTYTDVLLREQETRSDRTIDLAGFAHNPHTYRNACIGVVVSNGPSGTVNVSQHIALGAPMIFEIDGPEVNRWKIAARGEPELKERFSADNIERAFDVNRNKWEPGSILAAKTMIEPPGAIQLDFVDAGLMPFLEGRNFEKLDYLLRDILTKCTKIYRKINHRKPTFTELFPLAFRFIAAKVFRDRGYPGPWTSNDALVALQGIEAHYKVGSEQLPPSAIHDRTVIDPIWDTVCGLFRIPNFSEDDLALSFEKTFITPQNRRDLGTHSTPPRVAEYIVRKLPFHTIPEDERRVLEPFSGHGRFLVAAMKRMKELLHGDLSEKQRHDYLVQRLVGIELEAFAVEVCRLSLMMADEPNPNGWRLHHEDVFATNRFDTELEKASIVLCNPPFENFKPSKRQQYGEDLLAQKPAEVLRRVLKTPPKLLGFVLPSLFTSGTSYRALHKQLATNYGSVELVALPEVFNYSDATSVLLLASDFQTRAVPVSVTCRKVGEGTSRDAFMYYGVEPPPITRIIQEAELARPDFALWIPSLSSIWEYLGGYPQLSSVLSEWHRGVEWLPASKKRGTKIDKYISDVEKPGYFKGIARAENRLQQYRLKVTPTQYLSRRPQDQHTNAYDHPWNRPKVVCNASRKGRGVWRVAAIADEKQLGFSSRFIAFWPKENISIYALAGLLNSPICNAFLKANESGSLNRLVTFGSLPIPSEKLLRTGEVVDHLSRLLHYQIARGYVDDAKSTLLRIDAEILRAYDLPPRLEYELLAFFQYAPRPVPFEFTGYYPDEFDSYIPLHELISPAFEEARADRLLQRLTPINDPVISAAMSQLD